MSVYEQVKQALQDVVAPELKSIQVEIRRLDDKIDTKIESLKTEIKRLDDKVENLDKRLSSKIDSLDNKIDTAIEIRERLAFLEAKLASLEHG